MVITHKDFITQMDHAVNTFDAAKDMPNDGTTKKIIIDRLREKIITIISEFLNSDVRPLATA